MNPAGMVWQLMRRDPAWRLMPWLMLAAAVFCTLWHFVASGDGDDLPAALLCGAVCGMLLAGLTAVFIQSADTAFESIIPVTVRQVFVSRILSMVAMMLLPAGAGLATLMALKDPVTSDFPLEICALFPCTLLGIQCFAIRRNIRQWLIIILLPAWFFVCAVAGIGDLLETDFAASLGARAACWLIIGAVVLRTWQVLPPSFLDAPIRMSRALPVRRERAARNAGTLPWNTWLHIALLTSGWTFIPMFAGVLLVGTSNVFVFALLGFYWTAISTRFRWLLSLPVSPRILLLAGVLPTLLAICGGYALNIHLQWIPVPFTRGITLRDSQEPRLLARRSQPDCKTPNVLPSLEYWIPVRSNKAPLIEAPWGEAFQPSTTRVMGFDIYDPYAVGCDNSRRFLEWQFRRATVAIYGHPIPPDKKQIPTWSTAIPGLRTQLVSIVTLMVFSLLSLLIAMTFDWNRTRRLPDTARTGAKWLVGAAVAALLSLISLRDIDIIQWVSWSLPSGVVAAIAVECVVLALLFLGIDKLSRELEFTDKPVAGPA